jgi:glutathione S-transferase
VNTGTRAPLRLHGHPVSNYVNIARAALIEKHAEFEYVPARASKDPAFLKMNPMGKIPVLETPDGCIAETVAILEYIEDTVTEPALYPANPLLRARARQVINIVQMYVESPVRSLFPGVFVAGSNSEDTIRASSEVLNRAGGALRQLIEPRPFLIGDSLSYADLFAFYCLDIADRVTRFLFSHSILENIGGLGAWAAAMASRDSTRTIFADFYPAFAAYLENHSAPYDYRRDATRVLVPPASISA